MDVVVGIHAAAAVLLLIAGAAKIGRPQPTADLIAALGVPVPALGVRALGVGEVSFHPGTRYVVPDAICTRVEDRHDIWMPDSHDGTGGIGHSIERRRVYGICLTGSSRAQRHSA